jgi:hypothetical protein
VRRLKLELSAGAVDHIAQLGYDPVYGARPVKRALQRELQTLLAKVGRASAGRSCSDTAGSWGEGAAGSRLAQQAPVAHPRGGGTRPRHPRPAAGNLNPAAGCAAR